MRHYRETREVRTPFDCFEMSQVLDSGQQDFRQSASVKLAFFNRLSLGSTVTKVSGTSR